MQLISYSPLECLNDPKLQCKELAAYVRLDVKASQKQKALLQFLTTIFTGLVIVVGALTFADDTQRIVIVPITKMVGIIKKLADDPL